MHPGLSRRRCAALRGPVSGTRAKVYDRAVARNLQTFESGNRAGSKLTPELHEQFVSIVAQTGRISVASGKCGLGSATARHWMARGRQEESGPYREFLDAIERARSDFLLHANRRLNQLAVGGLVRMPAFDKAGNPIRNHKPKCGAAPGYPCECELVIVEKVLMPNPNVLMWQVDRLDPSPNGEPMPDLPEHPALTDDQRLAKATVHFDLIVDALKIMAGLGVNIAQLMPPDATIETTAVPLEPAKESLTATLEEVKGDGPATATAPPKPPEAF